MDLGIAHVAKIRTSKSILTLRRVILANNPPPSFLQIKKAWQGNGVRSVLEEALPRAVLGYSTPQGFFCSLDSPCLQTA